ncbi:MAG: hypothetical protein QOE90_1745 [Thermoplasmata archaeon]|jgi:hypothetical protein|nr:hypothetical protein [Thermoplasmata archaeon]
MRAALVTLALLTPLPNERRHRLRARAALVVALALAPGLAGCTLVQPQQPKDVTGSVDGYDPTPAFLKVHLRVGDQTLLVDFDRRDWNAAGIAQMIDQKQVTILSIHGTPRDVLDEVLVETVGDPSALAKMRWNDQTTPQEKSAADQAYDALVAKAHPAASGVAVTTPTIAVPTLATPP